MTFAISRDVFFCASWVDAPMCGVNMMLSSCFSLVVNFVFSFGSCSKTSSAAPAMPLVFRVL